MTTQGRQTRRHFIWVPHPRQDASLGVCFTIDSEGEEPSGYGRDFDPGCDPDISMLFVDEGGRPTSVEVADLDDVRATVLDRFDFAAARRAERDEAAELTTLAEVL